MNANQIFNGLKDPKFAPDAQAAEDEAKFLPVEVIAKAASPEPTHETAGLKRDAKNLHHITLPEIKDFNALCDV